MGKVAFVFSGQGDQFPGMGKELCETYTAARNVYEMCDSIRPDTSAQSFFGSQEELRETINTQPCLFAFEMAAAAVLSEKGVRPKAVAGFSLGEVSAAVFSRVFTPHTGFELVCKRAKLMQTEAEKYDTSMAAVVKLTDEQVEEICSRYKEIYPVNYNCPGQITVSGANDEMTAFAADVKAAGGRAIPVKVNAAYHSPFMRKAAEAFADEMNQIRISPPQMTLYSNMTAQPYREDIAKMLSGQICSPVRWEQTIRHMIQSGIDTFVEIGPGKTLTNMIRKIDQSVRAVSVFEYLAEVEGC